MEENTNILVGNRLQSIIDHYSLSPNEFAKRLGYSRADKIYNILKGKFFPSFEILMDITNMFVEVNIDYLLTGKEPMIKVVETPRVFSENESFDSIQEDGIRIFSLKTDDKRSMQRIPLYDFEAVAGLVPLFNDTAKQVPIDYIQIPNLPKCDGAIHVVGDSMYPLLKSGDIVLYKWVRDVSNGIFWGEMYLISIDVDGEEYVTVKYIQKSDQEGYIKLVSYNPHHSDKEIPINTIRALAFVKASIRINSMK